MKRYLFACGALLLAASGVLAHHSYAMFDADKTLTIAGAVKEFKWSNPHAWLEVNVPNDAGGVDVWGVEMNSPNNLVRQGWRASSLKPGDKVKVTMHPMRDGTKGGSFMSVELPDGKVLGTPPSASTTEKKASN